MDRLCHTVWCPLHLPRLILEAVRLRNRIHIGKADLSGQNTVKSVLCLVRHLVCILVKQLSDVHALRSIERLRTVKDVPCLGAF